MVVVEEEKAVMGWVEEGMEVWEAGGVGGGGEGGMDGNMDLVVAWWRGVRRWCDAGVSDARPRLGRTPPPRSCGLLWFMGGRAGARGWPRKRS